MHTWHRPHRKSFAMESTTSDSDNPTSARRESLAGGERGSEAIVIWVFMFRNHPNHLWIP
jgi:hypothetical protein